MSTITPTELKTSLADPGWIPWPLYRLTLDQYEAMVASGVFSGRERFHLINGFLVAKMTQNDLHATADELCGDALGRTIPAGWHVRAAKPIRIPSQASKPEPDRCVAWGSIRDYLQRSPEPSDIALVVEISDSRLSEDRKQAGSHLRGRRHPGLLDREPGRSPGRGLFRPEPLRLPVPSGLSCQRVDPDLHRG